MLYVVAIELLEGASGSLLVNRLEAISSERALLQLERSLHTRAPPSISTQQRALGSLATPHLPSETRLSLPSKPANDRHLDSVSFPAFQLRRRRRRNASEVIGAETGLSKDDAHSCRSGTLSRRSTFSSSPQATERDRHPCYPHNSSLTFFLPAAAMSLTRARLLLRPSSSSRLFSTSLPALKAPTPRASSSSAEPTARPHRVLTFEKKSGNSHFKTFLPVTASLRQLRQPISEHLHKGGPYRPLTEAKRGTGGRNEHGRITTRARGGGHKRRIRLVDFTRRETGEQTVERIEYDPGRSAHIALIKHNLTGAVSYILAPVTLRAGDIVQSFRSGVPDSFLLKTEDAPSNETLEPQLDPSTPQSVLPPGSAPLTSPTSLAQLDISSLRSLALRPGNCLPIRLIPVGTIVHAITLSPDGHAVLSRSAGTSARIISASSPGGKHAQVRLSSGEVRLVGLDCFASVGEVSNPDHGNANLGKAGRMRWLGFRCAYPLPYTFSVHTDTSLCVCAGP